VRIYEILFWDTKPTEVNHPDPQLDSSPVPFDDDLTKLGNAFSAQSQKANAGLQAAAGSRAGSASDTVLATSR
jgi:hypothetical protein